MYFDFIDFSNNSIIEIVKTQLNPSFYIIIKPPELTKPCQNLFILKVDRRAPWLNIVHTL